MLYYGKSPFLRMVTVLRIAGIIRVSTIIFVGLEPPFAGKPCSYRFVSYANSAEDPVL